MLKYFLSFIVALALGFGASAWAQGEHGRRAAVELLVLQGDARKLAGQSGLSEQHRKGLLDRLRGGLAPLVILLRFADQEAGRQRFDPAPAVGALATALANKDMTTFQDSLAALIKRYSFDTAGLMPVAATPARRARAKTIHEEICSGCHDEPLRDVERPAYNLRKQAQGMTQRAFAARLIVGVRGDRMTGLGNPFSDEELASLLAFYILPAK